MAEVSWHDGNLGRRDLDPSLRITTLARSHQIAAPLRPDK